MDAVLWHRHANTLLPTAPPPAQAGGPPSPEYLQALTQHLRATHFAAVALDDVASALSATVEANAQRPPGSKQILALTAPNAAGKSTLTKRWARARYLDAIGDQAHTPSLPSWSPRPGYTAHLVPVVYINLIAGSRIKEVNAQILTFLGYPGEGLTRVTTTRVVHALGMHQVRLVVVDDAHLLKMNRVGGREVLDYLKFLNTELGELHGTLVLVGAHLDGGPIVTDPQIEARLHLLHLRPFGIEAREEQVAWQRFLRDAETILLPYLPATPAGALSQEFAAYIWKRTQGYLGDTATLLTDATLRAVAHGTALTRADLAAVRLSERAEAAEKDWEARTRRKAAS